MNMFSMNQGPKGIPQPLPDARPETMPGHEVIKTRLEHDIEEFLGEYKTNIDPAVLEQLPTIIQNEEGVITKKWNSILTENKVSYDKFKKRFMSGDARGTAGEFVASRHWGSSYAFPKELESTPVGKKLVREATTLHTRDVVADKLNHVLATELAVTYDDKDMAKTKGFRSLAKRSLEKNPGDEAYGFLAEGVVQGTLERIAIDYEELGLSVLPGNAAQDVLQKIDFVITTKQKKRGVGIETVDPLYDEKHIGVQFTTNTSKDSIKLEQIEKSKARGIAMDDIVYVTLDYKTLVAAIDGWTKAGKPISGPWAFLDKATQQGVLKGLLGSVLTEEQIKKIA